MSVPGEYRQTMPGMRSQRSPCSRRSFGKSDYLRALWYSGSTRTSAWPTVGDVLDGGIEVTETPLWAQAESEAVRRMWVDAWALLEDGAALAREVAAGRRLDDFEAAILRDRIGRFLQQATATEPTTEAQCLSCANCGATDLSDNPTVCGLCGAGLTGEVPERHLRSIPGGDSVSTTKGTSS